MNKQRGFTLIELIFVVSAICTIAAVGGGLYVLVHFISKFW